MYVYVCVRTRVCVCVTRCVDGERMSLMIYISTLYVKRVREPRKKSARRKPRASELLVLRVRAALDILIVMIQYTYTIINDRY